MILGIDASNIRAGGGVTHLTELLRVAQPQDFGFERIIVWSGKSTLLRIDDRPWLTKSHSPTLDKNIFYRMFWQRFMLSKLANKAGCSVLLVPGGTYTAGFQPFVTMSRNMLPFEWRELIRYGWSLMTLKLLLLRFTQSLTFKNTDGLIFLTQYAYKNVLDIVGEIKGKTTIIPHGIDRRFINLPRTQLGIEGYSVSRLFRIIYVSIVDVYKHQWHVVEAVAGLRTSGLPVSIDLIGPSYGPAYHRLQKVINRVDPKGEFIYLRGSIPHTKLQLEYANAHLCVFASSCENMPNILIEGMASGLPVACSNRGPMPEVLGNAGLYFDPENPDDIASTIRQLIDKKNLRTEKAALAYDAVQTYSWQKCADQTLKFVSDIARNYAE